MMDMRDYQMRAKSTAVYPVEYALSYLPLKLAGESGEVAEKVGKYLRGDYDKDHLRKVIGKELGDVLWYVAVLAYEFHYSLDQIADINLEKLEDRRKRDVLKGSGDER